jgi:hypothetical protein
MLNTYEGVESSQQTLEAGAVLDQFVKKFAPEPKGDLALKIILDIVSFGLQAATGPFFNNCKLPNPASYHENIRRRATEY